MKYLLLGKNENGWDAIQESDKIITIQGTITGYELAGLEASDFRIVQEVNFDMSLSGMETRAESMRQELAALEAEIVKKRAAREKELWADVVKAVEAYEKECGKCTFCIYDSCRYEEEGYDNVRCNPDTPGEFECEI